jgi:arsenite methyltransferase
MKPALRALLADPIDFQPLTLQDANENDEIAIGWLQSANGKRYPVINGIPRLLPDFDEKQSQTSDTFGFKWKKRDTYDQPTMLASHAKWMLERYGFESVDDWAQAFSKQRRIMDLGCGSGFSSSVWLNSEAWSGDAMWVGVDVSEAIDVAQERLSHRPNTHFIQGDALQLPFPDATFDVIFSEGVLHHTPSTRLALLSAVRVLKSGGEIYFYVYKRKGPIREYTDDYIREAIRPMSDEQAWDEMRSLTKLAQSLAELHVEVEIEDVPLLGIKAGHHDVQRLIYWNFGKLYWNPDIPFESNVHINFDWYRPQYAHRQSEPELRQWCDEAGLRIERFQDQDSGFTVVAVKER